MDMLREVLPFRRKQATVTVPGIYGPIDSSNEEIRTIHLLPGEFDDVIILELATVSLSSHHPPQYDALSYVWGKEQCQTPALVNGRPITITSNLDVALRHFREKFERKTLWVDAVCINQQDNGEKGPQVQMMGQIYSKADQVLVWLGPAADGSDELFEKMSQGVTDEHVADSALQSSAHAMMGRAWFTRIWVQQEIALAARNPTICCGRHALCWTTWCLYILKLLFALEDAFAPVMYRQEEEGVATRALPTDNAELVEEKYQKLLEHIKNNRYWVAIQKAVMVLEHLTNLRGAVELASGNYNYKMVEIINYVNNPRGFKSPQYVIKLSDEEEREMFQQDGMDEEAMRECIKSWVGNRATSFSFLLRTTAHLDATDDRDRVFGLLGVARFVGQPIRADYNKTKREVYSEAMATIVREEFHLGYPMMSIINSKKKGLPSWVADIGDSSFGAMAARSTGGHPRSSRDPRGGETLPDATDIEMAMAKSHAGVRPARFSDDFQTLIVGGLELGRISSIIERPIREDAELANPAERFTFKDELKSLISENEIPMGKVWRTLIGNRDVKASRYIDSAREADQAELLRSKDKMLQNVAMMCGKSHEAFQNVQEHPSQDEQSFIRSFFGRVQKLL